MKKALYIIAAFLLLKSFKPATGTSNTTGTPVTFVPVGAIDESGDLFTVTDSSGNTFTSGNPDIVNVALGQATPAAGGLGITGSD
jgi:hypothetical protein